MIIGKQGQSGDDCGDPSGNVECQPGRSDSLATHDESRDWIEHDNQFLAAHNTTHEQNSEQGKQQRHSHRRWGRGAGGGSNDIRLSTKYLSMTH